MELGRDKILELLRERGDYEKADDARGRLPERVDLDEHGDLLHRLGIDAEALLGGVGNGLGPPPG
jgi:hypothetical protein